MSGRFSQNDLVRVTRENEVDPGVVVGGSRRLVYSTGASWTAGGNSNESGLITGDAAIQSVRAALRFADANIPSQLVFNLNKTEIEDQLRDQFNVAEITIAGDFSFAQNGTHLDGSTGPVITGDPGTFADLYSAGDFHGLMAEISGVAIATDNKWPRLIKDVKADGTQIDIWPLYANALLPGGSFRAGMVTETDKAGVLKVGTWAKNRGIQDLRSVNFEFEATDQPGGDFSVVRGCTPSGMKLSFTGKGNVEMEFMYVGMDYSALGTTSIAGVNPVIQNTAIDNEVISSGEDLAYFAVGGSTLLSGDNLTSFQLDLTGNASGIDDVAGSRFRPGVTVGDINVTGNFKVYHKHALTAILQTLGRLGTRVPLDFKLVDPAGNGIWVVLPVSLFEPNAAKPGQKGSKTDNTVNFKTAKGPKTSRTLVWQQFAAA